MLPRPNKLENNLKSYSAISILSIFTEIFEKLLLRKLQSILNNNNLVYEYEFGFRHKHATPERCQRIEIP